MDRGSFFIISDLRNFYQNFQSPRVMYNRVSINVTSVSLGIIITIITINSSSICFLDSIIFFL